MFSLDRGLLMGAKSTQIDYTEISNAFNTILTFFQMSDYSYVHGNKANPLITVAAYSLTQTLENIIMKSQARGYH